MSILRKPAMAAAAILSVVWLWLNFALASPAQVTSQPEPGRSSDFRNYLDYLNSQRARLDAEAHPDVARREPAAAHAAKLTEKLAGIEIAAVRAAVRAKPDERRLAILHLGAENKILPPQLLEAETRLAALQDGSEEAGAGRVAELQREIDWLRRRVEFFHAEAIAITGESPEGDRAAGQYTALIRLEEARIATETLTDPDQRRLAQASFGLQSERLRGKTLASAREALPEKQLRAAAREIDGLLKAIQQPGTSPAGLSGERQQLSALRTFYTQEIQALKAVHRARPSSN